MSRWRPLHDRRVAVGAAAILTVGALAIVVRVAHDPRAPVQLVDRTEDEEGEIDRVQLAQEFSGLLQMHRADDEASS